MLTYYILIASNFVVHLQILIFLVFKIVSLSSYWFQIKVLSKFCRHHWMPFWLLIHTTVTSAVTNFRCHKLIANVNKLKNSEFKNCISNQYRERLTKLEAINNAICLHFLPHLTLFLIDCRSWAHAVSRGSSSNWWQWRHSRKYSNSFDRKPRTSITSGRECFVHDINNTVLCLTLAVCSFKLILRNCFN